MKCEHVDCGNNEKIWLPFSVRGHPRGLKSHPFCIRCGIVKNIGSERAMGTGHYINAIAQIEKHLKIRGSSVRMRLAARELEKIEDFDDDYSMNKYAQEKVFIKIVKKYYQIPERTIQRFL